jgi:hypothetical protein
LSEKQGLWRSKKGVRDDGIKRGKSIEEVSKKTLRLFGAEEEGGVGEF